jgi:hypothetical protein
LSSHILVDRPSLSNPPSKIVAHKLCIAMHHQWVASYPSIASVPGRFTQRGYLLPISGWHRAHPLQSKKHPSGSSHTNPLLTGNNRMVHHHGYVHLSTHTHHMCHDASLSCCIQLYKFGWFGHPFWTHAYIHLLLIHSSQKEKLDLYCCIAALAKPMGRQYQTAQMKLMFVRWFGRLF